ncbi:hypothetical protein GUJ93_ZPchr0006g41726 [Zizania palustris]|uniref:Uncharacterized protein n=1 Tax=Zizania palustris TaxID=103762 RepID=A0A8J5VTK6_ZIZPA|nr:hypothetical protein GUJ93_ZPchr0006g41726 [Zizania palustris]
MPQKGTFPLTASGLGVAVHAGHRGGHPAGHTPHHLNANPAILLTVSVLTFFPWPIVCTAPSLSDAETGSCKWVNETCNFMAAGRVTNAVDLTLTKQPQLKKPQIEVSGSSFQLNSSVYVSRIASKRLAHERRLSSAALDAGISHHHFYSLL